MQEYDGFCLGFAASEVEAVAGEGRDGAESRGGDGVTHREGGGWEFPAALPCGWRTFRTAAERLEMERDAAVTVITEPPVARRALSALGLAAAEWFCRAEYLEVKVAVDAASRSRIVLDALVAELKATPEMDVLDVGAGSLSMVEPVLGIAAEAGATVRRYVAVDTDAELLAAGQGHGVERVVADVYDQVPAGRFDLVVANAFADLAPPAELADLFAAIDADLFYLPITFNGQTFLEPPLADANDTRYVDDATAFEYYNDHLRRVEGQHVDLGRLDAVLVDAGFRLVAGAPSDWRLPLGTKFASFIVDFISNALTPRFLALDDVQARHRGLRWVRELRAQAARPTTPRILCARNLDLLYRREDAAQASSG